VRSGTDGKVYLVTPIGALPVSGISTDLGAHPDDAPADDLAALLPGGLANGLTYLRTVDSKRRERVSGAWRNISQDSDTAAAIATAAALAIAGPSAANNIDFDGRSVGAVLGMFGDPDASGFSQSGFRYVLAGEDGNLLFGVDDGAYAGFVVPGVIERFPEQFPKSFLNLGGTLTGFSGASGYSQSGRSLVFQTTEGRELGGISDDPIPQGLGAFSIFQNARPEFVSAPLFDAYTRRDANGNMQVYSVERATGAVRKLSDTGTDNINIGIDAASLRVTWTTSGADRWPSSQLRARRFDAVFAMSHLYPKRALLTEGDSVDVGTGSTGGNFYAALAATSLSLAQNMWAIGGQQQWQQAMRLGAIPTFLTVATTAIDTTGVAVSAIGTVSPRTGATITQNVTPSNTGIYPSTMLLSTGADNATRAFVGWIIDSTGARARATVTRTSTGGVPSTSEVYALKSSSGVTITTATTTVQFIPDTGDIMSYAAILGGGLNDLGTGLFVSSPPTAATIMADVRAVQDAIVASIGPAVQAFVIMGMYGAAASYTQTGSAGDLAIIAHNDERRAKYPGRFVDRSAILAAAATAPGDNTDVTNHWVPTSLRVDTIHLNNAGNAPIYNGNSGGLGVGPLLSRQLAALPA
jgi:hypothetical protein